MYGRFLYLIDFVILASCPQCCVIIFSGLIVAVQGIMYKCIDDIKVLIVQSI